MFNYTFEDNHTVKSISLGIRYCTVLLLNGDIILVSISHPHNSDFIAGKNIVSVTNGAHHVMYIDNMGKWDGFGENFSHQIRYVEISNEDLVADFQD